MISFDVKTMFFDKEAVASRLDDATSRVLSRFGSFVRQTAKQSLRYRKAPSAPGSPPSVHRSDDFVKTTKGGKTRTVSPLKEMIYFGYDASSKSVVIGPAKFAGGSHAPELLEYGGATARRKNPRRLKRKLGDGGEIRLGGDGKTAKKNTEGVVVTYAVLETSDQVDRANQIQEQLYGPEFLSSRQQAARPFMTPAGQKEQGRLAPMFQNSISN